MLNKQVWKFQDWDKTKNCTDPVRVFKVILLVEQDGGVFRLPSIRIISERQDVDYDSTFEAVSLGNNRYQLKSDLESDHHTQLRIEIQNEQFIILNGAIFLDIIKP